MNMIRNDYSNELIKPFSTENLNQGVKRRNRLSPQQASRLMQIFEQTTKPRTEVRRTLAKELGMNPRAVQIWFQNRRQKMKKECQENQLLESSHILRATSFPPNVPFQSSLDSVSYNLFDQEYSLQNSKISTDYSHPSFNLDFYNESPTSLQADVSNTSLHESHFTLAAGLGNYNCSIALNDFASSTEKLRYHSELHQLNADGSSSFHWSGPDSTAIVKLHHLDDTTQGYSRADILNQNTEYRTLENSFYANRLENQPERFYSGECDDKQRVFTSELCNQP